LQLGRCGFCEPEALRGAAVGSVASKYCTLGPAARLYLDSVRYCADSNKEAILPTGSCLQGR